MWFAIDIKRRFERSWINFQNIYKPLLMYGLSLILPVLTLHLLRNRSRAMEKYFDYGNYAESGLKALRRAVKKAVETARKNNLKIPIWKNGGLEYIFPEDDTRETGSKNA